MLALDDRVVNYGSYARRRTSTSSSSSTRNSHTVDSAAEERETQPSVWCLAGETVIPSHVVGECE
jgi:hypothetical protein